MNYLTVNDDHINGHEKDNLFLSDDNLQCFLEEDDIQCGHIAYNAFSHVLKFTCSYCERTYDSIEYFCQHQSEHINSLPEEEDQKDFQEHLIEHVDSLPVSVEEESMDMKEMDKEKKQNIVLEIGKFVNYEKFCREKSLSGNTESVADDKTLLEYSSTDFMYNSEDYADNIVEEIEYSDNHSNASDMILEETKSEDSDSFAGLEDNSCSQGLTGNDEGEGDQNSLNHSCNTSNNGNSFEECFLKETNIEKIRSEGVCVLKESASENKQKSKKRNNLQEIINLKRKRRKVTTVKVIATKNRITELYECIRNQQNRSHSILSANGEQASRTNFFAQDTLDAVETCSRNEEEKLQREKPKQEGEKLVTQRIIGETLITLIPEGTKIPNTLPSQVTLPAQQCNITVSTFPKTENNSAHFRNENPAVCPACGKTFRSYFSLTIHKRIHYLESDSPVKLAHKCSDCNQLFNKLSQLKQHVDAVHYADGFVCRICNRKLSSLSQLERHMIRVHLERPFNCQECGKNFSDADTYDKHLASHNSGEIHKCHVCGRKYSTEFFLTEHLRNHKEQIPQTCVVCGKVTLRITQHMKIHTPKPKRLLSCSVCAKVFNFSSGLSHHFKIMHKLPRPSIKPKKEPNPNVPKRKRKPRLVNKYKKKQNNNSSLCNDSFNNEKTHNGVSDIIEEPSEIPDEVYDEEDAHIMLQLTDSSSINKLNDNDHILHDNHHRDITFDEEDVNHKEEEAKRVIVELIQKSSYEPSIFFDNLPSRALEVIPPIAREETISAVNGIVNDC